MSEKNVKRLRAAIDAYNRGDLDETLTYADPEVELHSAIIGGAEGNVYTGHEGFRRWYADTLDTFEDVKLDISELRDLGDRTLLLGRIRAVGRESGAKVDSPTGWIWTARDGLLVKAEGFLSHAEALEAAGLSE